MSRKIEAAIALTLILLVIASCGGGPLILAKIQSNNSLFEEHEEDDEDDEDDGPYEDSGKALGYSAVFFLLLTCTIALWKPAVKFARKELPSMLEYDDRKVKLWIGKVNRWYMKIHDWLGFAAALIGTLHGILLGDWNWMFWIGIIGLWILVISGYLMRVKWPPRQVKKGARLLHMQRLIATISIVFLWLAHD